jgi:anti-sigma factor RsiW
MRAQDEENRVPDLILERYLLGELPKGESESVARRLSDDGDLGHRLEALEESDQEIRRRYPPGWLAGRVRARLASAPRGRPAKTASRSRWGLFAALASAATVLMVLVPRAFGPHPSALGPEATSGAEADVRIKGLRPGLTLFRRTPAGSEALADGAVAYPGDLVRVGYRAAGRSYGVIVSIDGRGTVTVHLPERGEGAAALGSGKGILLDHAYELDDAPRWERFYLVTSESPFDVAPVVEAARRAAMGASGVPPGPLALPSRLEQMSFSLSKRDGR